MTPESAARKREYKVFLGDDRGPFDLLIADWNYSAAYEPMPSHRHTDEVEIHLCQKGSQAYTLGEKSYSLRAGEALLVKPGETHGDAGGRGEKRRDFYIRFPWGGPHGLLGLQPPLGDPLRKALSEVLSPKVSVGMGWVDSFTFFLDRKDAQPRPMANLEAIQITLGFLHRLIGQQIPGGESSGGFESRAAAWLDKCPDPTYPLELAAHAFGLSVPHFRSRFRQVMGYPYAEYTLRLRLKKAEGLLARRGASVTEVCQDLGFSSSQYFARAFRRHMGRSPTGVGRP